MRNLKKLLSVVLVVAMIAGLCAVGSFSAAAAEYSETTNYKEAAAVITGVGVMDGYEDGTMQYDKTVTREEAAAIICRALIGVDTAKKLSTAVAPFADVAANRWSAPYINYLKSQGIVNGKTATQFDPTAEVTAVEFAKMMLCAVGYGKAGEFVGASWDVNTITAANNNGIFTSTLAADLTAPATREQCMLYAYNTMVRVPVVNYNNAFQSYYVGTSVVSGIDTRVPNAMIGRSTNNPAGGSVSYDYTLAYRNFKLERTTTGMADDYGRDTAKWTSNGKSIVDEVTSVAPDYVVYGAINSDVLYKTLGKAVINDINASTGYANFEVYIDGVGPTTPITTDIKSGETGSNNMITAAGDTVELYVEETNGVYSVKAVVLKQYFAQVTKVDTSANKLYATVINGGTTYTNCVADGDDVNITGLKKDDYILVNIHNNKTPLANGSVISAIEAPKTAVATYKGTTFAGLALDFDGNMTFSNGTIDTSVVTLAFGMPVASMFTIDYQYTNYYDSLGNLIYAKFYDAGEAAGTTSYFYVKSAEADNGSSLLSGTSATLALDVVYANGGEETVKVAVNKDSYGKYVSIANATGADKYYFSTTNGQLVKNATATPITGTDAIADFEQKFFSFTKTADGFVKITKPNATYAMADDYSARKAYTTTPGKNEINLLTGYTATSSTVLTVIDTDGNVATYTGYANFPKNLSSTYQALYTFAAGSTKLRAVCLYDTVGKIAAESNLALCGGFWSHNSAGDIAIFYVDGEYKMLTFDTNNSQLYKSNRVYKVAISESGNTAEPVTYLAPNPDYYTGSRTTGTVNEAAYWDNSTNSASMFGGGYMATTTDLRRNATAAHGLGNYNSTKMAFDEFYAWSIIDDVDGNIFTTKAVKAGSVDTTIYPTLASTDKIDSSTYYFDSKTKIYDCRNNACTKLTELPTNVAFIAYINEGLYTTTSGVAYCEYIWIVG